jgi:predicted Zn-dependent protease with MMP-like domain
MNGVLQQAAPKPKSNPMLDQIVQQAEANVPENLKDQFTRIMVVGGKMMWSEAMTKEREEFDQLMQQSQGDVPTVVSHTVLKIISIIQNESKQEKPLEAVGLAAPIFMAHILQYVESKHGIQVTNQIIDETAQLMQVNLMKLYGVTEQHLQELIKQRSQGQAPQTGQAMAQSGTEGNTEPDAEAEEPADDEEDA